jgi:hypothetical protein
MGLAFSKKTAASPILKSCGRHSDGVVARSAWLSGPLAKLISKRSQGDGKCTGFRNAGLR